MREIKPLLGRFVQFTCTANRNGRRTYGRDEACLFTKHLLLNIFRRNVNVTDIFEDVAAGVHRESNNTQPMFCMNGLIGNSKFFLNKTSKGMFHNNA